MDQAPQAPQTRGQSVFDILFTNRTTIAIIAAVLLVAISVLPNYGVFVGWIYVLAALFLCIGRGSFAEIGFRRPESWPRTLLLGIGIGVVIQPVFSILVDPFLERWTGTRVDLSALDGMRGHLGNYLVMLAVGWVAGGFLEEMLFRGYLLRRIRLVLGERPGAVAAAVMLPALAFGLAHSYQDTAGMISTGLIGALFGVVFVWSRGNLWLPILVHGFTNVVGITLIYTDGDKVLNRLLFG